MRIEVKGQSLNDAIENAMIELSTTSDNIAYEVKQEGNDGFLGIGAKPFIIEAYKKDDKEELYKKKNEDKKNDKLVANNTTNNKQSEVYEFKSSKPSVSKGAVAGASIGGYNGNNSRGEKREATPTNRNEADVTKQIKEFLEPIFKEFDSPVNMNFNFKKEEGLMVIDLSGEKMGVIIGKHGQTLDALQHLCNIYVNKGNDDKVRIRLDSENYRDKRYKTLESLAKSVANNVRRTRTDYALEPMPSYERKIIHSILQKERNVTTESVGQERNRHVIVKYRGK